MENICEKTIHERIAEIEESEDYYLDIYGTDDPVDEEDSSKYAYSVCQWIKHRYQKALHYSIAESLGWTWHNSEYFDTLGSVDISRENIHPCDMGTMVDHIARFLLKRTPNACLNVIYLGLVKLQGVLQDTCLWDDKKKLKQLKIEKSRQYYKLYYNEDIKRFNWVHEQLSKNKLTDNVIENIYILIKYNHLFRAGFKSFVPVSTMPDKTTIKHLRFMANRSVKFLSEYEDITPFLGFTGKAFSQCKYIKSGDGDYWNKDIMFEMKVQSSLELSSNDVYQMIIYYMLSELCGYNFKKIIIFNPRRGTYYECGTNMLPQHIIEDIRANW